MLSENEKIGWQNLPEINSLISATIIFIISWGSLMFYQMLLSPKVKQYTIITYLACISCV